MAVKHYRDDIPPSTGRVYKINTSGGVSTITDATEYSQVGSTFGADDVNCACVLECNYTKNGTVHELTTENLLSENIKFYATSDFNKGDIFTFNGTRVVARTIDGQQLSAYFFKANTVVECQKRGNILFFASSSSFIADDTTSSTYRIGIENGCLYIEED